ncbi:MAG: hypothetical protein JNM90_14395, partial [Burkholderiales bacterium]|nr:hypothetical protein [Burkholderiales bacterium]
EALAAPLPLTLAVNGEVQAGRELGISVGLAAGAAPRALEVELAYDAAVLEPVGAAAGGAGRLTLTVQPPAPGAAARFRVIGGAGAGAGVSIAGVRFADGGAGDFALPAPLALTVRP